MDLKLKSTPELLVLHSEVSEELRLRKVLRSSNNPTGDLAEYMFCQAFGWKQENNSHAHVDAIDIYNVRYQIKARRMTQHNDSRQMSAIRNLNDDHFDFLAAVIFTSNYKVYKAAVIPIDAVKKHSKFTPHTNSHRFILRDNIWDLPDVRDVTQELSFVKL